MRSVSLRLEDLKTMVLNLGFVGENEHTRVTVDCRKVYEQYPNASAALTVQPAEGEAYPAVIERDGDSVIWDVTDSDLLCAGTGEMQLSFTEEPHLAKSYIGRFKVARSIVPTGDVPDPLDDFLTRAGAALTGIPETINSALATAKASGEFDGPQGPAGQDGTDGYSPTVAVEDITGGHRVTVTDAEGDHAFDVLDGEDGSVTDVKVNGTTVVTDGVANIPAATNSSFGVTTTSTSNGLNIGTTGAMRTYPATDSDIKGGTQEYRPIVAKNQHQAAFYGLAKASGDNTQASSSNPVGTYTADAIVKIQKMLGIYKSPWEVIRSDTITNAESADIAISVDDNGQPFELTDVAIAITIGAETGETASYGGYGRVRCYYSDDEHDDTLSGSISIAVGGQRKGFFALFEQNDNMLIKRATASIEIGNTSALAMYTHDTRTSVLYPINILSGQRAYKKIEFVSVKGIANFVIYGRKKWN